MGMDLRPCFSDETQREAFVKDLVQQKETFREWNDYIETHKNTMREKMTWYIHKNWNKLSLEDWNKLDIKIKDQHYGFKFDIVPAPKELKPHEYHSKVIERIEKRYNAKVKEITSIEKEITSIEFGLDITDGDLGIIINDGDSKWLSEFEIIQVALLIEDKLCEKD